MNAKLKQEIEFINTDKKIHQNCCNFLFYDLNLAVESIPAFVEMSKFFIMLVPPVCHQCSSKILDLSTWRRRGWCVAEAMARLLARKTGPLIKLSSAEGKVELDPLYMAWKLKPLKGKFSCCAKNHFRVVGGKKIRVECDKIWVGKVVHDLVSGYE